MKNHESGAPLVRESAKIDVYVNVKSAFACLIAGPKFINCHLETPTMTDLSADFKTLANYRPVNKVRFVTAASLFDGHDAAINIMRRILQSMGAEVIHLGHNRAGTSSISNTWSIC